MFRMGLLSGSSLPAGSSWLARPGLLCVAAVGVQLARLWAVAASSHFAFAGGEAAAGHRGHLLAGFDLAEHWFDGLGAEFAGGVVAVVAHPPGGARGGGELGQVALSAGLRMRWGDTVQLCYRPG